MLSFSLGNSINIPREKKCAEITRVLSLICFKNILKSDGYELFPLGRTVFIVTESSRLSISNFKKL